MKGKSYVLFATLPCFHRVEACHEAKRAPIESVDHYFMYLHSQEGGPTVHKIFFPQKPSIDHSSQAETTTQKPYSSLIGPNELETLGNSFSSHH